MSEMASRRAVGFTEVAEMFGVSRDTVKRLAMQGVIKTITFGGRRLVPMSEIDHIERSGIGTARKTRKAVR